MAAADDGEVGSRSGEILERPGSDRQDHALLGG